MKHSPDHEFRFGVAASYAGHHPTALCLIDNVDHTVVPLIVRTADQVSVLCTYCDTKLSVDLNPVNGWEPHNRVETLVLMVLNAIRRLKLKKALHAQGYCGS